MGRPRAPFDIQYAPTYRSDTHVQNGSSEPHLLDGVSAMGGTKAGLGNAAANSGPHKSRVPLPLPGSAVEPVSNNAVFGS